MTRMKRLRKSLTQFPDIEPPSPWLLAMESRAVWEFWAGVASFKALQFMVPRGDGHPVLVIPGLGAGDYSTALLRKFLDEIGYVSYPWDLGRNKGWREENSDVMRERLRSVFDAYGQKISLIGQSLGGVYARELARMEPRLVRQVIMLGSPFTGHPLASTGTHLYEWLSGDRLEDIDFSQHLEMRVKPPVPVTSVYSKFDGVVAWPCSVEEPQAEGESINLRGHSHIGMASAPAALYIIAKRLAQTDASWQPYRPHGLARLFFDVTPPEPPASTAHAKPARARSRRSPHQPKAA
jgi:pimeloyl-ACP methyl ester carboxylesterase